MANKLAELPKIDDALRTGEMSYSKVRAMTRVATPANEQTLLGEAQHTTGQQLETICRKYAVVRRHDQESDEKDDAERRHVRRRDQADGMVQIVATLHPEEAATIWAALERIIKDGDRARGAHTNEATAEAAIEAIPALAATAITSSERQCDVPAGTFGMPHRTDRAPIQSQQFSRADALLMMAEEVIRGSRPNRAPIELVVTVAAGDLRARVGGAGAPDATTPEAAEPAAATDPTAVACYADGTPVSLAVARRLACDAGLVGMVEGDQGGVLSVGRKTRTISAAMKRALLKRDGTCRFPGCTNRVFLHGHHMRHWADGGETELGNLVSLCGYHHRFVHEYGYVAEPSGNDVRFTDPGGNEVLAAPGPARPERRGSETIRARNADLAIDADTPACGWMVVGSILSRVSTSWSVPTSAPSRVPEHSACRHRLPARCIRR